VRIQLNGWQRIGAILSLLWVVSVCGYAVSEYSERGPRTAYFVEMVKVGVAPTGDSADSQTGKRRTLSFEDFVGRFEPRLMIDRLIAAIALPLIAAWALVYLGIIAVRWVAAGFRKNGT